MEEGKLDEALENYKSFMGDCGLSDQLIKLALKKCNLNLEETIMMMTNEDLLNDL